MILRGGGGVFLYDRAALTSQVSSLVSHDVTVLYESIVIIHEKSLVMAQSQVRRLHQTAPVYQRLYLTFFNTLLKGECNVFFFFFIVDEMEHICLHILFASISIIRIQ